MSELYFTPPPQEQFDEVKARAINIWSSYDDSYGYASEKIAKVKEIENVGDNFMCIVAMFDLPNQLMLSNMLSEKTNKEISDRLIEGGMPDEFNPFKEIK